MYDTFAATRCNLVQTITYMHFVSRYLNDNKFILIITYMIILLYIVSFLLISKKLYKTLNKLILIKKGLV